MEFEEINTSIKLLNDIQSLRRNKTSTSNGKTEQKYDNSSNTRTKTELRN